MNANVTTTIELARLKHKLSNTVELCQMTKP